MLVDPRTMEKLLRIEERYGKLRFEAVLDISMEYCETKEHYRAEPRGRDLKWKPAPAGLAWGGEWITAWFRGSAVLPKACNGRRVFLFHETEVETLCFVNGEPVGLQWGGNSTVLVCQRGQGGERLRIAMEAYAGHHHPGYHPGTPMVRVADKGRTFRGAALAVEREDVSGYVWDSLVLRQLYGVLPENSLERGMAAAALAKVLATVVAIPEDAEEAEWRPKLAEARKIMRPLLEAKNGDIAPYVGLVGHSHLDTAWMWTVAETRRKAGRTFSSLLNHMERFKKMTFIQSTPFHAYTVQQDYPGLFKRIQKMAKAGRWEPNGAMWVEPDCNVPSGESFVRQLLLGQQFTREAFGFTADTLWLPDTFGYSAALPQILQGANVRYFCTSKLDWNDTTRFPLDNFWWHGIDGTPVLAHLIPIAPCPEPVTLDRTWNWVQHKDVQDRRLLAFGLGDGGGGPLSHFVEIGERVEDLQGLPRTGFTTVSAFMQELETAGNAIPRFHGELYLELHRGTLTTQAKIKRNNRKAEFALRDAEFLSTVAALRGATRYPADRLREIWRTVLTNQFHDILPGSSIAEVHTEAIAEVGRSIEEAHAVSRAALARIAGKRPAADRTACMLLVNSLSWPREGELAVSGVPKGLCPAGASTQSQWIRDIDGNPVLLIDGVTVPAMGATTVGLVKGTPKATSPFVVSKNRIDTPCLKLRWNDAGQIVSCRDKRAGRELVRAGGALNTFLTGQDVPAQWDNWDIDADHETMLAAAGRLLSREVVADGPLQLRIRSEYAVGRHSTLRQDMVLHAGTPRIDFENVLDWNESHVIFKVGFDFDVLTDFARHEIQFGHAERTVHRNYAQDRARFEVCTHKWSDLSDNGFGVALLNDCKYGTSTIGNTIRLTLMRSPSRPDLGADCGQHRFNYAILPHAGGFNVASVVRPAYEFNCPLITQPAASQAEGFDGLVRVESPNVIVESVKWAEKGKAFIVRLYEAGKAAVQTRVEFGVPVKEVSAVNLLEEAPEPLKLHRNGVSIGMRAFAIKTLKCRI